MSHVPYAALLVGGIGFSSLAVYLAAIVVFFLSVFWRPQIGIYFLIPLLPMQTLRYLLHPLPYGEKLVDFLLLGVIVGLFLQKKGRVFVQSPLNTLLILWAAFHYISLWRGAFFLGSDLPLWFTDTRFSNWKNYMIMPLIFFVVAAAIKEKRQMQILLFVMMLSILRANYGFYNTVTGRDFSHFSYGLRYAGVFGYAGENGLAAFEAQFALFCLGLFAFMKGFLLKTGFLVYILLCLYCLVFSFSRGGYLGFLLGILFLGVIRERKLLVALLVLIFGWQTLVPNAVTERIFMTYEDGQIESSAGERVTIWQDAITLVPQRPIFGTGFDTYEFMGRVEEYRDTHNLYLKILLETGVLGLIFFLILLWRMFKLSFRLYRSAADPFFKSLGLGTAACILCAFMVNFFGDRWMYLQVNGYVWTLLGLVVRAQVITDDKISIEESVVDRQSVHEELAAAHAN